MNECDWDEESINAEPSGDRAMLQTARRLFQVDANPSAGFQAGLRSRLEARARAELPRRAGQKHIQNHIYTGLHFAAIALALAVLIFGLNWVLTRIRPIPGVNLPEDNRYLTPIPTETLAAYRSGIPIEDKLQAVIAARANLNYTRLNIKVEPNVYSVEKTTLGEAHRKVPSGAIEDRPDSVPVWLVIFIGDWQNIPPSPGQTPTPSRVFHGCTYVLMQAADGERVEIGPTPCEGGTPTPEATPLPPTPAPSEPSSIPAPTEAASPTLALDQLKNRQYCGLVVGCETLQDGQFVDGERSGQLLDLTASGDLNADGQLDAVLLLQETYFGTTNIDLVAVLNQAEDAGETAVLTLGSDIGEIRSIGIAAGLIQVDIRLSGSLQDDPAHSITEMQSSYQLTDGKFSQVHLVSQTQDGQSYSLDLEPLSQDPVTGEAITLKARLPELKAGEKIGFNVYDVTGSSVYSGESNVTPAEDGTYNVPVDLAWVAPGKLRVEIEWMYTTPTLVQFMANDSVMLDFQPVGRAVAPALFTSGSFKMVDEHTGSASTPRTLRGWACSAATGELLRTDDGGRTWHKISIPLKEPLSLDVLDANTAWVFGSDMAKSEQAVYMTQDGGNTWEALPPLPATFPSLSMLDTQEGFLTDNPGGFYMMGQTRFILYHTQDGAKTWEKVFDNTPNSPQADQGPGRGRMIFRDAQNGWNMDSVIGQVALNSLYLMRTRDGGHIWADQDLPMPDVPQNTMLIQEDLKFFAGGKALMPLLITPSNGDPSSVRLFVSTDGGDSWSLSARATIRSNSPTIAILSGETVVVWDGVSETVTTDAGQTWSSHPVNASFSGNLATIQFITPETAFALVNDHNPEAANTTLYRTINGGQTWEQLDATIAP